MPEFVRKMLTFRVQKKLPGSKSEMRLFTFGDRQADLYTDITIALANKTGVSLDEADTSMVKTVTRLLAGQLPPSGSPKFFHEMRLAFPILSTKDVEALPRFGCPRGKQPAVILAMVIAEDMEGNPATNRLVRFDMTPHQQDVFYQGVGEIAREDRCSRDEAWQTCVKMVGRFIRGDEIIGHRPHRLAVRFAEAFAQLDDRRAINLPAASDDDIRLLQFTEEPA